MFFTGMTAVAHTHPHRFTSSLNNRPDEKEVPIPMLALICTAVSSRYLYHCLPLRFDTI